MLKLPSRALVSSPSTEQLQITMLRAKLAAQIERMVLGDGVFPTVIPHLTLGKVSRDEQPVHTVYRPALCVIAQGCKRVLLGGDVYLYDTSHYLVFAQNLPVAGHVANASPEAPHLALRLDFDPKTITSMVMEMKLSPAPGSRATQRGIFTGEISTALLEPLLRLTQLLESPDDIPTLAPMVEREILYRLLKSTDGWRLAQMAMVDGNNQRVTRAIEWLRRRYRDMLRVEELAEEVHMSASALHHHFKAVTAMTPLQYQKQLRLQEARRIMLSEHVDAATAGHRVGYESQSQFNREYSRFFGSPPARDIKRLREERLTLDR
jgi:AraC-like DNA-binding protein